MALEERLRIADEIIRRIDTITILTCEEVTAIRNRAILGEFDDFWDKI